MSSAVLVPYERFDEYSQRLNRRRRIRPAESDAIESRDEHEPLAVAAFAIAGRATTEEPPRDVTD
jgi:hypothetical protein